MLSYLLLAITAVVCIVAFIVCRRYRNRHLEVEDVRVQLQSVLDNMCEGFVVMDRDRNIKLMNRTASDLISVGEQGESYALVEEQFEAFSLSGEPLPYKDWPSSKALRGEFVQNFGIRHRHRTTGKVGARIMSTAPMPGRRKSRGHIIISYRDDTERTLVHEARNRLASIVESSNDAIVSTTLDGTIVSWNKGAEKILGYTALEMIGKPADALVSPDAGQLPPLELVRNGETVEKVDRPHRTKSGRDILMDISICPIRVASGGIVGASIIGRDITATRNLEKQFQQAQKMEAIGQLTGGIAHDFNNLLGIVSGNLDLLEDLVSENVPALRRVMLARKATSRAADLTRRLLAFSSKETLNPRPTSLEHSVRNALEIAIHALGPSIRISTDIASVRDVYIDPAGLEGALLNLMVNARDAMDDGGGLLHVITAAVHLNDTHPYVKNNYLPEGEYALVSVTDTGCGMSKETLERVFEPFFTTKERGRGTGLGLPMVYGFARQSKGCVRIYSEPDHGTTVSLYLPFAVAQAVGVPETTIRVEQCALHGHAKILLVDDELDLLDVSSAFLNKLGYDVLLAGDGPQALALLANSPHIDLLITDIVMPGGMNGVELSHAASKLRPLMKTIYTSGFPADALAEKNLGIGTNVLLNKPYRLNQLGDAVSRTLQTYTGPSITA